MKLSPRSSQHPTSNSKMRQTRSKAYRKLMTMYSTSFGFRQPYLVLGAYWACLSESQRNLTSLARFHFISFLSSVDSEMCETAVSQKIDLLARMESVLVGSIRMSEWSMAILFRALAPLICPSGTLVITQCCIHELYLQGKSHQPAVDLAKSFERRKCNHKEAIPGNECIAAVVGASSLHPSFLPADLHIPGEINKHRYVIATQSHPLRVSLRAIPGVPIVHINRSVMVLEPASDATMQTKQRVCYEILRPPHFQYSSVHFTGRTGCARAI